jgi:hypothetical protein
VIAVYTFGHAEKVSIENQGEYDEYQDKNNEGPSVSWKIVVVFDHKGSKLMHDELNSA